MKIKVTIVAILVGLISFSSVFSQDSEPKYGKDSTSCVMNNSLYYEFYKQWKQSNYKSEAWKDAYKPWSWVFKHCPKSTKNIYLHGEKLVEEKIKTETDKDKKEKYIDTLMQVYDKRIKYFGNEGYVLGKKGADLYLLRPSAYEQAFNLLKKSIELEKNESDAPILIYYFRTAEKMVKEDKLGKDVLVDIYDKTSEIIEYNINKFKEKGKEKDVKNWENVQGNIELSFEPYATCPDLVSIYSVKFSEEPDDVELLRKITRKLDKRDCTDTDLFLNTLERLVQIEPEPSASSAELLGKLYIKREKLNDAVKYLKKAIELQKDDNERADVHYLLANVLFQQNKHAEARANCYDVIKIRPNEGKAYILIGDMYSSTAKSCGDNDLTTKVAYWAAVDKYYKAKAVDASVAELANTKINTFTQYFPATETIFFYDLKKGDPYTVGCWINESTTVRTSD
ncbi:MAG: tetratricopeptide repeat protein [Bacteroidales bacterium]|nr:tetratricopeptide repeat protein [Bacteroidales bacterium]MCF8403071.1 tetratricopeptide repeat protein [Bacteroidales bacterium]